MSANKHLIALATTAAMTLSQSAFAQEPAGDSAYQWGRWAVLSPAAGGEPFRAPDDPGAYYNVRPGDLYGPEVASLGVQTPVQPPLQPPVQPPVQPPIVLAPPTVQPNPPGALPPIGDGRVRPPAPAPGSQPPIGDGRVR